MKKIVLVISAFIFLSSISVGQNSPVSFDTLIKFVKPIGVRVSSLDSMKKRMLDTLANPDGYVFEEYANGGDKVLLALKKDNYFLIYQIQDGYMRTAEFKRIDFKGYGTKDLLIRESNSDSRFARDGSGGYEEGIQFFSIWNLDSVVGTESYSNYYSHTTWDSSSISEQECGNFIPTFKVREIILDESNICNEFKEGIITKIKKLKRFRYVLTKDGLKLAK